MRCSRHPAVELHAPAQSWRTSRQSHARIVRTHNTTSRIYARRCASAPRALSTGEASSAWLPLSDQLLWQGQEADLMQPTAPHAAAVWKDCLRIKNIGGAHQGLPFGPEVIPGDLIERQVILRCGPAPHAAVSSSGSTQTQLQQMASSKTAPPPSGGSWAVPLVDCRQGDGSSARSTASGVALPEGFPLVYAMSWWNEADIERYMKDSQQPIWVNLSEERVELYRDIKALYLGSSEELQALLCCKGPLWGRHYVFWHRGKPLTIIYEVFSSALPGLLGGVA